MNKQILRDISYGMYIITSRDNDKLVGCTINTLVQITSENPTVLVSLNKNNYTNEIIKKTKKFAISILSEDTSPEVIGTFGFKTSKEINKFSNINYDLINDIPIIKDKTCGYIVCSVLDIIDVGTHDAFIGKIENMNKYDDLTPMTYKYYHEVVKGKAPKNAPTYIEEKEKLGTSKKYYCTLCGYIYDDGKEKVPFEKLPDDWKCPICGAPKSAFKEME